ncbi:hypothetical protein EI94DRAFT_464517 [Lactarius quietus]|nr:hypothetical protein EI94DRAFT_464517 [Lactarius quietus]
MADYLNAPGPTTTSPASETALDINHSSSISPSAATLIPPNSSARSPGVRGRPRLPAGPRTRNKSSTTLVPSKDDPSEVHTHTPPLPQPPAWSADVQLTNPFSPTPVPLSSTPPSQPANLPPLAPHQSDTFSTPQPPNQYLDDRNVTTSRPGTPTPLPTFSPPNGSASRKPSHATVYSTTTLPLNLPAAQLNLTPEALPYKYLTLDAAHWTLTSTELQSLVSSAIRDSAKEQFIRLLPLSVVDVQIPEDVARIERSWETAAARWRFEAHRRNMLLRALAASGADIDLLTQLSGTLGTLDSHAQDLIHAATHRTQIAAARDTHRSSALAVALRKLNASYARRTRDLDKARTNINALRSEIEEAWKVAEEQAAEVDRLKSEATSAAAQLKDITDNNSFFRAREPATDDDITTLEDDTSDSVLHDGASIELTSRAEVVDVTGTAVVAQARLTKMPSPASPGRNPGPGPDSSGCSTPRSTGPPPSAFAVPCEPSSPATPPLPSSASQVSRVSAARRRSARKSKASLRLPSAMMRPRSRSVLRGEANISRKATRSKSRSRKGKERDASSLPWLTADVDGSFLEMEGRPVGEEDADPDGEADVDEIGDRDEAQSALPDAKQETGA